MRIRLGDKPERGRDSNKPRCKVCGGATREGKPFCSEHIEQSPYLQRLQQQIADKEAEEELVAQKGAAKVSSDSETVREIRNLLETTGPRTLEAISKETQLDAAALKGYISHMKKRGEIQTRYNRRGSVVAKLTHQQFRRNPSWLEERDYHYMEPLEKRIRRLCYSDLSSQEISDHLNVPSGFVHEICKTRRPRRNPQCICGAGYDEPHLSWCEMSVFR